MSKIPENMCKAKPHTHRAKRSCVRDAGWIARLALQIQREDTSEEAINQILSTYTVTTDLVYIWEDMYVSETRVLWSILKTRAIKHKITLRANPATPDLMVQFDTLGTGFYFWTGRWGLTAGREEVTFIVGESSGVSSPCVSVRSFLRAGLEGGWARTTSCKGEAQQR